MIKSIISLVLLFTLQAVKAQEESTQNKRSFKIACWSSYENADLYIGDPEKEGEEMEKLKILNMRYSKKYYVESGNVIHLYKKTNNEEKPYELALNITIPAETKVPLVLLMISKKEIKHKVYDIDPSSFPFGSYRVVNLTKVPLYTMLGSKKMILQPMQDKAVTLESKDQDKAFHSLVKIKKKEGFKEVYSNMLRNRPKKRMLMFFYTTKDEAGRPTIKSRSLVDFFRQKVKP